MKHVLIGLIFLFSIQGVLAQKSAKLSGKIINPKGDKDYLYKRWVANGRIKVKAVDSSSLSKNGSFELKTTVDGTEEVLFYDGFDEFIMLMSPGDKMEMTVNTVYFDETIHFTGKGSEKNNAAKDLALIKERYLQDVRKMVAEDEIDTVAIFAFQEKSLSDYRKLLEDYNREISEMELVIGMFEAWVERDSRLMKKSMRRRLAVEGLKYKKAIDFSGVNLNGDSISLSDFKGKIIVVDFWATWCVPCKEEFPTYKKLEEKYGNDVNFISVGINCKEEDWREMAQNEGFKNNMFIRKEQIEQISGYEVNTLPRYLVIDKNFNLINGRAPKPSSGELEKYWR